MNTEIDENGTKRWYNCLEQLDREDGPAIEGEAAEIYRKSLDSPTHYEVRSMYV